MTFGTVNRIQVLSSEDLFRNSPSDRAGHLLGWGGHHCQDGEGHNPNHHHRHEADSPRAGFPIAAGIAIKEGQQD